MEVARTSMIHAAAPHFLWPFAVQYAAHQLNLWPRPLSAIRPRTNSPPVRFPVSSLALSLTRLAGGFTTPPRAVSSPLRMSPLTIRYPFTVSSPTALPRSPPPPLFLTPGVLSVDPLPPQGAAPSGVSQVDPVEPVEVAVDFGPARGTECAEPGGAGSGGTETGGAEPGGAETGGAEPGSAETLGAEPGGTATWGAEPGGAETGGAETGGAEPGGAPSSQQLREWYSQRYSLRRGATGAGGSAGVGAGGLAGAVPQPEPPSPKRLREWYARCCSLRSGAPGVEVPPAGGPAAGGTAGTGAAGGPGGAAGTAGGPGAGGGAAGAAGGAAGAGGGSVAAGCAAGAGSAGGSGAVFAASGGTSRPRLYFVPLLQQVLGQPPPPSPPPSLECPPPVQSQSQLPPASPLPGPSPYTGPTGGLTERREPESRSVSLVSRPMSPIRAARTGRRSQRERPPLVPGTHFMTLRPSTAPQRVPLPSPPESSVPVVADPESDSLRAASPTVTRLLATAVTDPSFESAAASSLVAELVDFAARCCLDYAASLVAESESVYPPSVGGECALGTDVLEDKQEDLECLAAAAPHLVSMLIAPEGDPDAPDIPTPRSYAEAIAGEYSSQWQSAMDAEMASWKSTGTYLDEVPPPGANIGVDFFQTFSPTPKMTTLRVLLHVAAQHDYELLSLDFSTAFLHGSQHEEIWLRRPPGFTGSFPPGTRWSLRRPVYGLRQAPREWHDTLRTTLAALGFAPSTADPSLFLRTDTSLLPFYILVYVDDLVFATADTEALAHMKLELQKRRTCIDLGELRSYLGLQITRDRVRRTITLTQSHMVQQVLQRFGFTWSSAQANPLAIGHSLSALPSDESVEPSGPYPELVGCLMYLMTCTRPDLAYPLGLLARYVAPGRHRKEGAKLFSLGTQTLLGLTTRLLSGRHRVTPLSLVLELRWLAYLLTDLGEQPSSPPVLYVDNKAAIALCEEHRLEQRMKHIALRYFLARELQQRGQLRLRYVATQANTADIFTKALEPCDHQRFCTMLGLVPTVPHLL
ncbi:unnamed protein product [Closterium sp. NIES-54]